MTRLIGTIIPWVASALNLNPPSGPSIIEADNAVLGVDLLQQGMQLVDLVRYSASVTTTDPPGVLFPYAVTSAYSLRLVAFKVVYTPSAATGGRWLLRQNTFGTESVGATELASDSGLTAVQEYQMGDIVTGGDREVNLSQLRNMLFIADSSLEIEVFDDGYVAMDALFLRVPRGIVCPM